MKNFCLLLLFVLLKVSADDLTDYKREIAITNAHIEIAYNTNNITVDNTFIANGLEHVIKTIVYDEIWIGTMINMIAVPEYNYLNNLQDFIEHQRDMQEEIKVQLKIPVPEVQDQNFERLDLTRLGDERRRLTGIALKRIINRILNFGNPANLNNLIAERRLRGTGVMNNRIISVLDSREQKVSLLRMCRLIALFISSKFPTSLIKILELGSNSTCILWEEITSYKTYREIDGEWWQVGINDINTKVQPLKEQLR